MTKRSPEIAQARSLPSDGPPTAADYDAAVRDLEAMKARYRFQPSLSFLVEKIDEMIANLRADRPKHH